MHVDRKKRVDRHKADDFVRVNAGHRQTARYDNVGQSPGHQVTTPAQLPTLDAQTRAPEIDIDAVVTATLAFASTLASASAGEAVDEVLVQTSQDARQEPVRDDATDPQASTPDPLRGRERRKQKREIRKQRRQGRRTAREQKRLIAEAQERGIDPDCPCDQPRTVVATETVHTDTVAHTELRSQRTGTEPVVTEGQKPTATETTTSETTTSETTAKREDETPPTSDAKPDDKKKSQPTRPKKPKAAAKNKTARQKRRKQKLRNLLEMMRVVAIMVAPLVGGGALLAAIHNGVKIAGISLGKIMLVIVILVLAYLGVRWLIRFIAKLKSMGFWAAIGKEKPSSAILAMFDRLKTKRTERRVKRTERHNEWVEKIRAELEQERTVVTSELQVLWGDCPCPEEQLDELEDQVQEAIAEEEERNRRNRPRPKNQRFRPPKRNNRRRLRQRNRGRCPRV